MRLSNTWALVGLLASSLPAAGAPAGPTLERLVGVRPLPAVAERELASHVIATLLEPSAKHKLPRVLKSDKAPRMIFASVSDGRGPARVVYAAGEGAADTVERLLAKRGVLPAAPRWVKVDVVRDVVRETDVDPRRPLRRSRSLHGLAIGSQAFLPEELVTQTLIDSDQLLRLPKIAARLETPERAAAFLRYAAARALTFDRFSTSAYFSDGSDLVPLYRGNRTFDALTPDLLLEAARLGGEYLKRSVGKGGRFVYSYRPKTDAERDKYNILRHAGTVYSMLELFRVTGDRELLAAAERALGYLRRAILPCPTGAAYGDDPEALCVFEKSYVKLGGNALAIVALVEHAEATGSGDHLELIDRLGRWLLATQSGAGEFLAHKAKQSTGELDDHVSQYYPGEAVLALLRGSRLKNARSEPPAGTQDPWLDAAARAARWLIEVRDKDLPEHRLNHDHWLLYALNELYRRRPEPLYLEHARRITGGILKGQNRQPSDPDWLGSYYRPPRSTPTATRSEGLAAAYQLERDLGDKQRTAGILEGLELGVRFQLKTQFRPESALYLPNPRRALGGFRRSLTHYEVRIDYVQHNISALLLLRRILLEGSGSPA